MNENNWIISNTQWLMLAIPVICFVAGFFWTIGRMAATDFYTTQVTRFRNRNS